MINYKNYNLNINENFEIFLISKLTTPFIYGSTFIMKYQSIAYVLIGKCIYI